MELRAQQSDDQDSRSLDSKQSSGDLSSDEDSVKHTKIDTQIEAKYFDIVKNKLERMIGPMKTTEDPDDIFDDQKYYILKGDQNDESDTKHISLWIEEHFYKQNEELFLNFK